MQRAKWFYLPFLFVLIFTKSLYAISFKDILFTPAVAEFQIDDRYISKGNDEVYTAISNHTKIELQESKDLNDSDNPTLTFYRYDLASDSYLTIIQTYYQPNENSDTKFNPMTPLILDSGEKIDISKKIPAIKCQIFKRNEPLIIVYKDEKSLEKESIKLDITTDKDRERIELYRSDENSSLYVGYINTKTGCLKKYDGVLFVERGTEIKATVVDILKKSRAYKREIYAIAGVEHVVFEQKGEVEKKDALVWVKIESNKYKASVGEFVKFDITIENRGDIDIKNGVLVTNLSKGLKYKLGSKKRDIGVIKAKESREITYIALVDIDAKDTIFGSAYFLYNGKKSNITNTYIKVKNDFIENSSIFGRVKLVGDDNLSLSGIKLYLENGKYSVTDRYGKFHFSNINPDTHVVSIDPDTIKGRFSLVECRANARTLKSKSSYFVDTRDSHIKRVDFCVKQNHLLKDINSSFSFKVADEKSEGMPEFVLDDFDKYKDGFIWPKEGYVPPMPSIKVAFLHKADEKMVLYINGKKVDMLNYDGFIKSRDKKRVISKYRGIDIVDGDNLLEAKIGDRVVRRVVHLSTSPVKAVILKDRSTLVADGKNPIVIAVQLFDASGYPIRKDMVGKYSVQKPYIPQAKLDRLKSNPLSVVSSDDTYVVSDDGIAYIYLQPTTKSGEVKLHFAFQNSNEYLKSWISAKAREWFIVGFAEGSIGYKILKERMKKIDKREIFTDNRVSFFAKGKVSSDALLTIAYDSGKKEDLSLLEEIDLDREYTIYADASIQKNEAPSRDKLYIKLEKRSFYTLFGEFDTNLDTHELSKYSRRLNGIKSEFHGEQFEYNAFISQNNHSFKRDEITPDGTSGLYYLSAKDILVGSEKVYLEVRDRYRDEIILSKKPLLSIYDYNIDYFDSTLYFKEPISKRDREGNPQFIIVEYEVESGKEKSYTYGGRGAMKLFDGILEFGMTALGEDKLDGVDTLYGFDAKLNATKNLTIDMEYAKSKKVEDLNETTADAYLVELSHHNQYTKTRLYFKRLEDGFGFSQQSVSQGASQRYGADMSINYFEYVALKLSAYGNRSLKSGDTQNVAKILAQYLYKGYLSTFGYRYINDSFKDGSHSQIVSTISKAFFENKLKLSAAYEFSLDGRSDDFYDRTFAEASYFINRYVDIFSSFEILKWENRETKINKFGIRSNIWKGATLKSSISQEFENDLPRVYGGLGFQQNWQLNKKLSLMFSIDKEETIKGEDSDSDFTSYSIGASYKNRGWVYNTKVEYKTSHKEKKKNLDLGIYTQVDENLGLAFGTRVNSRETKQGDYQDIVLNFSLANRHDKYLLLNQLKYIYSIEQYSKVSKVINSLLFEIYPMKNSTLSAHYGIKYIEDFIDDSRYDSLVDTVGFEFIYELNRRLDLGVVGSFLHSYETKSIDKSYGTYLGYNIFKNSWLGVGYNFSGFKDRDFSSLRRSEQGAYLKYRLKFDQESLEDIIKLYK